jgi:NTP pyrophosphatase (non-canonical NTP hydrolase)
MSGITNPDDFRACVPEEPEHDAPDGRAVLLNVLADQIHKNAVDKGFWENDRNNGECIALAHSELSEALEALRKGNPPDHHCPEFDNATVEFADCIIRILDLCGAREMPIGEALIAKMRFNATRPHKHGKEF